VTRDAERHLSFGFGIRLGAALARLESSRSRNLARFRSGKPTWTTERFRTTSVRADVPISV
jgi:hypothetical protein